MRNTAILFASLLALTLSACASQDDDTGNPPDDTEQPYDGDAIVFSAAFTEFSQIDIYDLVDGQTIDTLQESEGEFRLNPGEYGVQMKDELGGDLFAQNGRIMFMPGVINGELILDSDLHQVVLIVYDDGYTPPCNGVSHPRACMVWESVKAMYGSWEKSQTYSYTDSFEAISQFPYIADKIEAWNALRNNQYNLVSCREQYGTGLVNELCPVPYGYMDTAQNYAEQDNDGDGQCSMEGCHGGSDITFATLVGCESGDFPFSSLIEGPPITNNAFATTSNMQVSDWMSSPDGRGIVVRVTDIHVVLFSSNIVGGGHGKELVGLYTIPLSQIETDSESSIYHYVLCHFGESECALLSQ